VTFTRPPTVADTVLNHKRYAEHFKPQEEPKCECDRLRALVSASKLTTTNGLAAAKVSELPASFGPLKQHLQTGLTVPLEKTQGDLRRKLDAFLPHIFQLHTPLGEKDPYLVVDGSITSVFDPQGASLGDVKTTTIGKLYTDYCTFKWNYTHLAKHVQLKSFTCEVADLLRRYNNKLTTSTKWAAPGDLYHLILCTILVAVEGFASPLNVHPDAIIYYSLEERDVVFSANINTFCNQQARRTPSARNPPFIDHILLRTLEWPLSQPQSGLRRSTTSYYQGQEGSGKHTYH
jgi:hypothetical protein